MYRLLEVGEVIENGDEIWADERWSSFASNAGEKKLIARPVRRLVKPAVPPAVPSVPDPGDGYRLIDKAVDKPEKGDEIFILGRWQLRDSEFIGDAYCNMNSTFYRRKLPAVPAVDPGEGWRLLKEGEKIERDDQFWHDRGKEWLIGSAIWIGDPFNDTFQPMRRRIPQPAPVVSVGDRVKVLSGPWAGCTGVVIGSLPMNLKIKMDNVFVGGNNLTMIVGKTSSVEPLPLVVPEVLYRDLSHGETVKAGDQFWKFGYGPWTDAGPKEIGDTITTYKARHRRPVRVQSPGWRYLDAGETVQAGDETEYSVPPFWRSSYLGRVFEGHDKFFRRKLPANQCG